MPHVARHFHMSSKRAQEGQVKTSRRIPDPVTTHPRIAGFLPAEIFDLQDTGFSLEPSNRGRQLVIHHGHAHGDSRGRGLPRDSIRYGPCCALSGQGRRILQKDNGGYSVSE